MAVDRFERSLTEAERASVLPALEGCSVAPRDTCLQAVERTRLVTLAPAVTSVRGPRTAVAYVALASRADGITLGTRVFVRHALVGDDGALPLGLVAHEVAHVVQYLRDGTVSFLARYVSAYLSGRARGMTDEAAYLAIPYEVEARAVAASLDPGRAGSAPAWLKGRRR